MKRPNNIPQTLVVGGLLLIVVSFLWPLLFSGRQVWQEEEAREYQQASEQFHALAHSHAHLANSPDDGHAHEIVEQPELIAARERYQVARKGLESARSRGWLGTTVFRWSGVIIAAAGLVAFRFVRST